MNAWWSVAAAALIACAHADLASAQADNHAEALTRASCQPGKQSAAVKSASAVLERDPDELAPRMRLADALVDQGCYQEAVTVLEAGQQGHPRNSELAGKLRDVRSLVTEQTYIEGLTQAAEGAKFQRNQLRCTRLADITACDDALRFKPDDPQLVAARADALKSRLAAAETVQASTAPPTQLAPTSAAAQVTVANAAAPRPKTPRVAPKPVEAPPPPPVASLERPPARTYSNDAPAGQTN